MAVSPAVRMAVDVVSMPMQDADTRTTHVRVTVAARTGSQAGWRAGGPLVVESGVAPVVGTPLHTGHESPFPLRAVTPSAHGSSSLNGPGRDRTCDLGIKSPLLYQLSYRPRPCEYRNVPWTRLASASCAGFGGSCGSRF